MNDTDIIYDPPLTSTTYPTADRRSIRIDLLGTATPDTATFSIVIMSADRPGIEAEGTLKLEAPHRWHYQPSDNTGEYELPLSLSLIHI